MLSKQPPTDHYSSVAADEMNEIKCANCPS